MDYDYNDEDIVDIITAGADAAFEKEEEEEALVSGLKEPLQKSF
jgi:hypothetical protein